MVHMYVVACHMCAWIVNLGSGAGLTGAPNGAYVCGACHMCAWI